MARIAIVGTGIAAMSAGYFLQKDHDITFFEKNDYIGGHTNTLMVDEDGQQIPIDSAFMVYNEVTYPNLTRLFERLDVETKNTNMSFSVQHLPSELDYCGTGLNGLFAQRRNLLNPKHYKMLMDINRFNKESIEVLNDSQYAEYSIDRYINEKGYGKDILYKYLIPMSSAVWSTPTEMMLEFPIVMLVRFFKNHGFLGLNTQHQWKTVEGGSRNYRAKLMANLNDRVQLNNGIVSVKRNEDHVVLEDAKGSEHKFDKVILGSHADQTLKMLKDKTDLEETLLSKFPYLENRVTLHTDESIMPKTKLAWSSWNYRIKENEKGQLDTSTIYYMNKLQGVSQNRDYFISVNELNEVDRSKIIWEHTYMHPLFGIDSIQIQPRLKELNKDGRVYFCGAYFRYGFHEDGLLSGIDVAKSILGRDVWL